VTLEPPMLYAILAIAVNIGGGVLAALGMNVQKQAHLLGNESGPYFVRPRWIIGFFTFTIGQLLILGSLGYASQALLAAISNLQLVSNAIFATIMFGEKLFTQDYIATFLIILGSGVSVAVYPTRDSSPNYDVDRLERILRDQGFWIYVVLVCLLLFVTSCYVCTQTRVEPDTTRPILIVPVASSKGQELSSPDIGLLTGDQCARYQRPVRMPSLAFCYALIAAIVGSFVQLFAKMFMQLLRLTMNGDSQFHRILTYIVLILLIFTAFSNIHFLNLGLREGEILVMIPTYYVLNLLLTVVEGLIFFKVFHLFSVETGLCFSFALGLTVIGITILSARSGSKAQTVTTSENR